MHPRNNDARLKAIMKMNKAAMIFTVMVCLSACSTSLSAGSQRSNAVAPVSQFVIGPADVLSISVWNHKDLNRTVTVRPDGKITFSLVGDLYVAGLEPESLQLLIEEALREYMTVVPGEVSVVVDSVRGRAENGT